jgi:hypothetical protein
MRFRWIVGITLWTCLSGPILVQPFQAALVREPAAKPASEQRPAKPDPREPLPANSSWLEP